jgi:hypothetical protein
MRMITLRMKIKKLIRGQEDSPLAGYGAEPRSFVWVE